MAERFHSRQQKKVLTLCRAEYGPCLFNCAKDGAANCEYHIRRFECVPAQNSLKRKATAE